MINLRILTHTSENFASEKLFIEYLNNLDLNKDDYMLWTNSFHKYDSNNELLTEDDVILFVYKGLIYAKGIIYKHLKNEIVETETLENGYVNNYRSKTYFKEIIKTSKIDIHEFCHEFDVKLGNGVGKIEVDENILDEYFEEYVEFRDKEEYLIKKDIFLKNKGKHVIKLINEKEITRKEFVNQFNILSIQNMELENYVIGMASLNENGKKTFCYILERTLIELGNMRGAFVNKFGVWYDKENNKFDNTKIWGSNPNEALDNINKSICELIVAGNNEDYKIISENKLSPLFKGKILTTYYPDKYIGILNEDHINYFLKKLNIYYDVEIYNNIEMKKKLLLNYKNQDDYFKNLNSNVFVHFLYESYSEVLCKKDKSIEILYYNFEEQKYNYIAPHICGKRENITLRKADYKKAYDNKEKTGNDGENAILNFEIKKLKNANRYDLAKQVDRVSLKSDAFGYDIKSFDIDGSEIHIEVKTTRRGKGYLDFYLTENELKKFIEDPLHKIYYIFDLDTKRPKYHIINKESFLSEKEKFLKPVLYKVMIDVDNVN